MFLVYNLMHHLRQVRKWAAENGAEVALDPNSLEMVVKRSNRKVTLLPRFLSYIDASRMVYTNEFPENGRFAGWLPYQFKRWNIASGKLPFKTYCMQSGLRVPAHWGLGESPAFDYIVKPDKGSFGSGIRGPFKPGVPAKELLLNDSVIEQFIQGKACKIWYWDSTPIAYIVVEPPTLTADGRRSIGEIVGTVRGSFDVSYDLEKSADILAWQGMSAESVPAEGAQVQLDFLYGHAFMRSAMDDPDCLAVQAARRKAELLHIGRVLHMAIPVAERQGGVVFTVDGVLDRDDQLWLLEMNCHTVVHPNAYQLMLNACIGGDV
jgi:hypothetical protein